MQLSLIKHSLAVLVVCLCLTVPVKVCAQQAELVWAASGDNRGMVLYSAWDGERWSEPKTIYQGDNPTATPVLNTSSDGSKVLIWSEQQRRKSVLMWSKRSPVDRQWSPATVFSRVGVENVAPTVVRDLSSSLWVFWSVQKANFTDVYYTREHAGSWSEPVQVNASNAVPDIKPLASLDELGNVLVEWRTYDFDVRGYVVAKQIYAVETQLSSEPKSKLNSKFKRANSEIDPHVIPLPNFIDERSFATMHIVGNTQSQSMRIEFGNVN